MSRDKYAPFYRPSTRFNNWVERLLTRKHLWKIDEQTIERWQQSSHESFLSITGDGETLNKVKRGVEWALSNEKVPRNVWYGECMFKGKSTPKAIVYLRSPCTRLPFRWAFEFAGQIGMDHIYGHLYPFYAGSNDFGEETACYYQCAVARARQPVIWKMLAYVIVGVNRFHKKIPLLN